MEIVEKVTLIGIDTYFYNGVERVRLVSLAEKVNIETSQERHFGTPVVTDHVDSFGMVSHLVRELPCEVNYIKGIERTQKGYSDVRLLRVESTKPTKIGAAVDKINAGV